MAKALTAAVALIALAAFRLGRVVLGTIGLWQLLGPAWAILSVAILVFWRITVPTRIGIVLAAVYLWSLPWLAALLLAAPRLPLMLPAVISTALARVRHPRPIWRGAGSASA